MSATKIYQPEQISISTQNSIIMSNFEYFLEVIYPASLIVSSLVANILVILVYSRRKFKKLPTRNILRLIALIDITSGLQLIKHLLRNAYDYNIYLASRALCKLLNYISYTNSIVAWLLVYISCERFLSIMHPKLNNSLRKFQNIIVTLICVLNLSIYSQDLIYIDILIEENETYCHILDLYQKPYEVFSWYDLCNAVVIPFLLMSTLSVILIFSIFHVRSHMRVSFLASKRRRRRDVRFSMTLILLNAVFITFNLPITIYLASNLFEYSDLWFNVFDDLYYTSFAVNFFIYLIVNSVFRKEFSSMIGLGRFRKFDKYKA